MDLGVGMPYYKANQNDNFEEKRTGTCGIQEFDGLVFMYREESFLSTRYCLLNSTLLTNVSFL